MQDYPKIFGIRSSALLEIVLFFAIMLVLDWFVVTYHADWGWGSRYSLIEPHPFWIIILLTAVQYGTGAALIAAIAATLAYLIGNIPPQALDQDRYSYLLAIAKLPILWFVAAVFLGEIRQRHLRERAQLVDDLAESEARENTIATSYARLRDLKENLELRVAGQFRSTIEAYRAAKDMEKLNTTDVLGGIQRLVSSVLNPEQFSLFLTADNRLDSTIQYGWVNDARPNSYPSTHPLYNAVVGNTQLLSVANSEQERILQGDGVLAGPLLDTESGEILGMLKVERLGFLDLNLSTIETFRTLCEWIGMTLVNARRYQLAKSESLINPDHKLMSYSYFQHYTDYTTSLAKRVGFDVSMLMVTLANAQALAEEQRRRAAILLSESVHDTLRAVDLAFDYQTSGAEYAIVLPATDQKGARVVLDKISQNLNERMRRQSVKDANFSFAVTPLHHNQRRAG